MPARMAIHIPSWDHIRIWYMTPSGGSFGQFALARTARLLATSFALSGALGALRLAQRPRRGVGAALRPGQGPKASSLQESRGQLWTVARTRSFDNYRGSQVAKTQQSTTFGHAAGPTAVYGTAFAG